MLTRAMEYPELQGKTVARVWFKDDNEFTALFLEFADRTRVLFDLKASVTFERVPEICTVAKNGDLGESRTLEMRPLGPGEA